MAILCEKEQYIQKMEEAFKYKKEILKHIRGESILDFGCGSGILTSAIKNQYPNSHVVGYDREPQMIEIARRNGTADKFISSFPKCKFDTIVLCSVMHEVYSYGRGKHSVYSLISRLKRNNLNRGGRIIIRDGFLENKNEVVSVDFKDKLDGVEFYRAYSRLYRWGVPEITETGITGNINDVKEFCNKYTWGFGSLPRESQEKVNFFSIEDFQDLASTFGLLASVKTIKQADYFHYLRKKMKIKTCWNTNVIIILQEVSV